jgi:carboxypeptidase Taq
MTVAGNELAPYERFLELAREITALDQIGSLLSWDQEVVMPSGGARARGQQKAALAAIVHERTCSEELGSLLEALAGEVDAGRLDGFAAANVREMRRFRERAVRVPRRLVRELAEAGALAQQAWVDAKRRDEWNRFAPHLERLVALKREEAEAVGYDQEPYDALLDEFEPGARVADLLPLFASLEQELIALLGSLQGAAAPPTDDLLHGDWPVGRQEALGRVVLQAMGYDFESGRLDTSAHPFTQAMSVSDVRITSKYDPGHLGVGLYANLHEGGHALYELGLPPEHEGEPAGAAVSLGIHESQSRLWENSVGRSREFWQWALPLVRDHFPGLLADATSEDMYRAINVVRPSLIRIEADEVTYNLHIILRLELERALLRREIEVGELPALWRERFRRDFGLEVPSDREGPLQDIHWAFGVFGYFPTYTLGNLYAAQFFSAARRDLPDLPQRIAGGDFAALLGWLREKVHRRGSLLLAGDLCREVTGGSLSPRPYLDYLKSKFGEIYAV